MDNEALYEFAALLGGNRAEAIRKINDETSRTNLSIGTLYGFYKMVGRFPHDDEVAVFNPLFKLNLAGFPVGLDTVKMILSPIHLRCLLDRAINIATKAHAGQTDKAGVDYILHPKRVAEHCNTLDEKIVAILHDTLEDSNITPQMLLSSGFPEYIVNAVVSVTKEKQESYTDFVLRAKANPIGKVVKINDLLDNMDLSRLKTISESDLLRLSKYIDALRLLIS